MTKQQINAVLDAVRSWPEADQEELAELAREIEARRKGIYVMTEDERAAIAGSRLSDIAADEDVDAYWKSRGVK